MTQIGRKNDKTKQIVWSFDNLLSLTARGRLTFLKSKASNNGSVSGILELAPPFKMLEFWKGNFGISHSFEGTRILEWEFWN